MSLEVILGPMFSGKTTEMFRRLKRFTIAGQRCVVIKYNRDQRYSDDNAATHEGAMLKAVPAHCLADVIETIKEFDVIGIDEGQFYSDLIEMVRDIVNLGKVVVVSALDGDFRRLPFGRVLELIPMSEKVTKLTSVCTYCRNDASFTRRLTKDTELEVIGGSEMYVACCRKCWDINTTDQHLKAHDAALQSLKELTLSCDSLLTTSAE